MDRPPETGGPSLPSPGRPLGHGQDVPSPFSPFPDEHSDQEEKAERQKTADRFSDETRPGRGVASARRVPVPEKSLGQAVRPGPQGDVASRSSPEDASPSRGLLTGGPDETSALEDLGRHAWSLLGIGLVLAILLAVLSRLVWLVGPVVVMILTATIAAPVVARLTARGWRRGRATAFTYIALILGLGVFLSLIGPSFASQVSDLAVDVPGLGTDLSEGLRDFQDRVEDASPEAAEAIGAFRDSVEKQSEEFGEDLADTIFALIGVTAGLIGALLVGVFVSLLIVMDLPSLSHRLRTYLDQSQHIRLKGALHSMQYKTSCYVRGQLLVAIISGILKTLMLWLVGMPYFVPLGVLAGIGDLIPGVGPVMTALPPILIAFSSDQGGLGLALLTLFVFFIVQIAVYYWFAPTFSGPALDLPTLSLVVALVLGVGAFGIFGLLFAIPVASAVRDGFYWARLPDEELLEALRILEREIAGKDSAQEAGRGTRRGLRRGSTREGTRGTGRTR